MAKKKMTPAVKIETVERYGNEVVVRGTSECLGERRVEVIVNGDLNRRYVACGDENGAWKCRFTVDYNGTYKIEASIRDYSDFNKIRQTTPDNNYFLLVCFLHSSSIPFILITQVPNFTSIQRAMSNIILKI